MFPGGDREGGSSLPPTAVWRSRFTGMEVGRMELPVHSSSGHLSMLKRFSFFLSFLISVCFLFSFLIALKEWKISVVADSKYRKTHLHIDVSACNCIIPWERPCLNGQAGWHEAAGFLMKTKLKLGKHLPWRWPGFLEHQFKSERCKLSCAKLPLTL